jgi:hypothetical protein
MRPDFVTNEDIHRWSVNIRTDPAMKPYLDQPIILEACYAGLWLCEELEKVGCADELIVRIQYTAGQLCYGQKDPWKVHQEMLDAYNKNELEFEIDYDA